MLSELQELDKILMKTMPEEEVEGKKLDDEFDDPAQIYDDDEWKKHMREMNIKNYKNPK